MPSISDYYGGLDLGIRRDYSALAIVERVDAAQLGTEITAVTVTSGDAEHRTGSGPSWSVPKRDLLAALQVALDKGELRLAHDLALACWRAKRPRNRFGTQRLL